MGDLKVNIKGYLKANVSMIDKEIEKMFPKKISKEWLEEALGKARFAYDEETCTKALAEPIWDLLERGGKRWRPCLALLVYEAFGGKEEKIKKLLPLIEFAHNGSLIHDDIEDDGELRRGKPCIHKKFGIDLAVNAGSAMYFLPFYLLFRNKVDLDEKTKLKIYNETTLELLRIHFGQAMDILWHKGRKENIKESEYLQMCAYKTGVLVRLSAKIGAILAGAKEGEVEKIGKFAESLGVGFQIQDDILSLVGEEFHKGKGGIGEDIHEGKRTLMVIYTLNKANESERKRLIEILNSHPEDEKTIREAIELMKKNGAIEYAKEKAKELVKESWKEAEKTLKEGKAKETLKEFANYLIERKI